ncbi:MULTISPECIES: hypothetical protein [unclassified Mesorhizobium]|uniref:hypothetical protein n=1 Tax=unclassified Mesorhizobium TaxID=325217 RepID=UPI0003CE0287|nr:MULTISPECIES: hypothetical protein [unclassified Mesorhizobium]ESX27369.1 hypothetical protein X765_19395 [Mesorhizobium sp. LSHC440B00]ESX35860.1 hypothetical protein X763_13710 [Mesorhizobium sp. LSHC432A00]ESX41376.1 hypothetical protein X764_13665 [Mesorhizobium sp. LSHC440A00]ESX77963.1 hypothetical protein X757_07000 [Mesorhizobium sp. LSHC414A00]WJI55485.1 hypothetical protein NLY33_19935 [Mesorhizobium sp. C432A]
MKIADLVDQGQAAQSAIELYGMEAPTAVAHCALEAHFDGRPNDFRFGAMSFTN